MISKRFIQPLLALLLATLAACQPTPPALPTAQPSATPAQLAAESINPTPTSMPPQPTGTHTATPLPAATPTRRPRPTITPTPLPTTPTYPYTAELVTTLGLGSILDIAFHPTEPDTALVTTPFGTYSYTSGQAPALLSEGRPLIYSPDGTLVINGLEVRDRATGALLFTLAENTFAASFQADGQFVTASVRQQGVGTHQEIFAAATGELLQTLPGIATVSFNQAGTALLATQQFGRFIVYSWPDLSEVYRIDPPMRGDIPAGVPAYGIFLPNGSQIALSWGHYDPSSEPATVVELRDARDGAVQLTVPALPANIAEIKNPFCNIPPYLAEPPYGPQPGELVVAPNEQLLAIRYRAPESTYDHPAFFIRLHRLSDGQLLAEFPDAVRAVFSPDSSQMLVADLNGQIQILDTQTLAILDSNHSFSGPIYDLQVAATGAFAAAQHESVSQLWRVADSSPLQTFANASLRFSPAGDRLLVSYANGQNELYQLPDLLLLNSFQISPARPLDVRFLDNDSVAISTDLCTVSVWNVLDGRERRSLAPIVRPYGNESTAQVKVPALIPVNNELLLGVEGYDGWLWNWQSGELLDEYSFNAGWTTIADAGYLWLDHISVSAFVASFDPTPPDVPTSGIDTIAIAADQVRAATGSNSLSSEEGRNGLVELFNLATGDLLLPILSPSRMAVTGLQFGPGGNQLFVAGLDGQIRLYQLTEKP